MAAAAERARRILSAFGGGPAGPDALALVGGPSGPMLSFPIAAN
ncbi:hypothetical protein GLE_0893 [Lysobacter enzymogenes]|uniref:Uncharacterized protein n=1 Tax=Lysobacter enzymogenes TaxID=69 RepID=A0A0S2DCJ8_LYSEN|nr:hypothetical protein GLE_0893 [Lysobacter enzymogenes]